MHKKASFICFLGLSLCAVHSYIEALPTFSLPPPPPPATSTSSSTTSISPSYPVPSSINTSPNTTTISPSYTVPSTVNTSPNATSISPSYKVPSANSPYAPTPSPTIQSSSSANSSPFARKPSSVVTTPSIVPRAMSVPDRTVDYSNTVTPVQMNELNAVPARAQEILDFWFGPLSGPNDVSSSRAPMWFSENPEFDRQIRNRYEDDIRQALSGKLDDWRSTPQGRLALILLLDQFPRHIYRNLPKSLAFDTMARGLVVEGLQQGDDKKLFPIERVFFYMPFQHSEDLGFQNQSVKLYLQLVNEAPSNIKPQMEVYLRYAILSKQTIARFKRFPYRNKILGRSPTPEEMIYLNQREANPIGTVQ